MSGYSDDINHAFAFAAKYRAPYVPVERAMTFMAHPANAAVILARHGADDVTLVAAIVHHVLEVAPASRQRELCSKIEDKFGVAVVNLAREAVDSRADERGVPLPWMHRKRSLINRLLIIAPRALDICCADEIHECGTAIAVAERLGGEYLGQYGYAATAAELLCYDDVLAALERRTDWHARTMKNELHGLRTRLESALSDNP